MKKKINTLKKGLIVLLVMSLILSLAGCSDSGSKKADKEDKEEKTKVEASVEDDEDDEKNLAEEGNESSDEESADKDEKEEVEEDEKDENPLAAFLSNLNGLVGEELYMAVMSKDKYPDVYYESTSIMADGTTSEVATYRVGDQTRNEIKGPEGNMIQMFDSEGTMYTYNLEEGMGMKSSGEDMDMDDDMDDVDVDMDTGIVKAEITDLNGRKVLYVEQEYSSEGMTMTSFNWVDIEFGVPVKTESYMNGALSVSSEVTTMTGQFDKSDDLFVPDEGIEFIDMDDMFSF